VAISPTSSTVVLSFPSTPAVDFVPLLMTDSPVSLLLPPLLLFAVASAAAPGGRGGVGGRSGWGLFSVVASRTLPSPLPVGQCADARAKFGILSCRGTLDDGSISTVASDVKLYCDILFSNLKYLPKYSSQIIATI